MMFALLVLAASAHCMPEGPAAAAQPHGASERAAGAGQSSRSAAGAVAAGQAPAAHSLATLDDAINARLREAGVPGLSVAIVEPDGSITERAYGVRSVETREPLTADVLFRNASTSKMWTAAALLRVMEQRGLSLHAPIGTFVNGLRPALARLTVHQLLSHMAGLADGESGSRLDEDALAASLADPRAYLAFAEPGAVMSYSNPGYQLAGYVLEQLTGKPFADAMDALILRPIGASRTTYRPMMAMTYPLALGHARASGRASVIRPMPHAARGGPSGFAFTTAGDAARFARLILCGGRGPDGTQLLSPAIISGMTTGYGPLPESGGTMRYGYGFWIRRQAGQRVWEHGGGLDGFSADVTILPDRRLAIVILANAGAPDLIDDVERLILEGRGILPRRAPARATQSVRRPVPAPLAATLIGQWAQGEYVFSLRQSGGNLTWSQGQTVLGTLYMAGDDLLTLIGPGGQSAGVMAIVRDSRGNPAYLSWGGRSTARLPAAPARGD